MIKQHGGMLAKGRLLGIQFLTLMEHDLYLPLAKHANDMAQKIQQTMFSCGVKFFVETPTNQIFPILSNSLIEALRKDYMFQNWSRIDDTHSAVRFVTSWAAPEAVIDTFCADFKALYQQFEA